VPIAALEGQLREAFKNRPDKVLYLKADAGLPYGTVVEAMDRIRRAGVERLGMVTEPARER
jgi:biopolymer transport protein TolR